MRWLTRPPVPTPVVGAQRFRHVRAVLPRACSDGFTYWLERVWEREQYFSGMGWILVAVEPPTFQPVGQVVGSVIG